MKGKAFDFNGFLLKLTPLTCKVAEFCSKWAGAGLGCRMKSRSYPKYSFVFKRGAQLSAAFGLKTQLFKVWACQVKLGDPLKRNPNLGDGRVVKGFAK